MASDQVAAEDEEEVDADPAETIDAARQFEAEQGGVVKDYDDDGEGAEKVEAGLAFTRGETRIDFGRQRTEIGGQISKLERRKWKIERRKRNAGSRLRSFRQSSGTGPA